MGEVADCPSGSFIAHYSDIPLFSYTFYMCSYKNIRFVVEMELKRMIV